MPKKVRWRTRIFDPETPKMLIEAERRSKVRIRPVQGSYSRGSLSAGTHTGSGAVDVSVRGLTRTQIYRLVKEMRRVGFSAWYRTRADGFSPHIHGIANGQKGLAPGAKGQVTQAKRGQNGLKNRLRDPHAWMKIKPTTWAKYKAAKAKAVSSPKKPTVKAVKPAYPGKAAFKVGSRHPAVKLIQRAFGTPVTGKMSRTDVAKVKTYQAKYKSLLPADGVVGPKTYTAIKKFKRLNAYYK